MKKEHLITFFKHFVRYFKCSVDHPVVLVVDNHCSHLDVDGLEFAKKNGITVLSFPPHCSHKLQPLDRSVFRPMKKYVNKACDDWMVRNSDKYFSIYDVPEVVNIALPLAASESNIKAAFKVSGIHPFNSIIFQEEDFKPNYFNDRPVQSTPNLTRDSLELKNFHFLPSKMSL